MNRTLPTRALVVLSLVLASTGCGDSAIAPVQAAEAATPSDQEKLLLTVLDRLDDIQTQLDQQTAAINQRLDSIAAGARLAEVSSRAPGNPGTGNNSDTGLSSQIAHVSTRTDSIMALVDFLAKGAASPWQGFTVCGGLGVKGAAELKSRTMATGEGQGGVGVKPWDTGALAQIAIAERGIVDLGAGAELQLGVNGCLDLSKIGTTLPPTRSAINSVPFNAASAPSIDQLQSTLMNLKDQLGLDEATVSGALTQGTDIIRSGDFTRLGGLASNLPVPAAFRDPLGTVRSRITNFDPVGLLCGGGNFGSRIGPYVSQGCQLIQSGNLPDISSYPLFSTNLSNLQDRFGSLCSQFNTVIDRRLKITDNLPWGGSNVLDVALFPSSWKVSCG